MGVVAADSSGVIHRRGGGGAGARGRVRVKPILDEGAPKVALSLTLSRRLVLPKV
jgi:hypothetical protein